MWEVRGGNRGTGGGSDDNACCFLLCSGCSQNTL